MLRTPIKWILTFVLVASPAFVNFNSIGHAQTDDDDKVYAFTEVDVKAKIRNRLERLPERKRDCPDPVQATVRAVLHKSGKVTEVIVTEPSGCSYDAEVVKVVRQLKFTPALKDGHPVSQYSELTYKSKSGYWRDRR